MPAAGSRAHHRNVFVHVVTGREVCMKAFSSIVALGALIGSVALVPVVGGILFSFILFGGFLLALVGVIGDSEDRTVRQHEPSMDPYGWRR
jgi:hypothetical protein